MFLILFLIFFLKYFYLVEEGFIQEIQNKNRKTIILLGDSILNNRSYVSPGDSVEELLKKRTTDTIYNFAQDNATIHNVVQLLNQIPEHLNNSNTTIFLSLGGNDIIHHYIKNSNCDLQSNSVLQSIFIKYEILVHMIRQKMNKSHIFLLDIYYPTNNLFQRYKPILQEWNRLLETNNNINNINNNIHILKISQHLNQHQDFTNNIEPSKIGGEKIANLILQSIA